MSKRDEEQIKLSATFLNGLAIACVTLGALTPMISYFYGLTPVAERVGPFTLTFGVTIWTICGIVLHLSARSLLAALDR
ncbi:MAG: hypothetical protein LWW93_03785 [Hyphomicrobiales bacterium]|nr:hypothetical protein [Hyphomicrobiales bacterium]